MIEGELALARCAIVLWSKTAILSRWVRDEAQAAINGHKLVPAILDGIEPPMGFRRIQAADLAGWRGDDGHSGWQDLKSAVGDLLNTPSRPDPRTTGERRVEPPRAIQQIVAIALAYVLNFFSAVLIYLLCDFVTDAEKPGREPYLETSIFIGVAVSSFMSFFASLKIFAKLTSKSVMLSDKWRHVVLYCLPAAGLFLYFSTLSAVNRLEHYTTMIAISAFFCIIAAVAWWQMLRSKVSLRQAE